MIQVSHVNTINGMNDKHDFILHIQTSVDIDKKTIYYSAANSPDYRTSFTGSALPFHNEEQAFDKSENSGFIIVDDNKTGILKINYPNAYYKDLGNTYVKPNVKIWFYIESKKQEFNVKLSDGIQVRSLTNPYQRKDSEFYNTLWSLLVRSQESILRDSSFPETDKYIENFWGLRPPK